MENLSTQTYLRKLMEINKVSGEAETTETTEEKPVVKEVGGNEHLEMNMVSSTNDNAVIGGKEVDLFGTFNDDFVVNALNKGFSNLASDIISKMKQLIWDLHHAKTPDNPDIPDTPDNPDTPDPDNSDGTGPKELLPSTKTLARGDKAWTATFKDKEQVLTLSDPFGGKNYQYKIKSKDGSSTTATFEFLKNGRLVITGDNIIVEACENQKDDLIVLGNNNIINTGDLSDTVRVGYVFDSNYEAHLLESGIAGSIQYYVTEADGSKTNFYTAVGNQINTGAGDDYVTMFGSNYNIDMGDGNDKFQSYIDTIEHSHIKSSEYTKSYNEKLQLDGLDGWTNQGDEGDCRLLAIINSFCGNNNAGNISKFAKIETIGNNYKVTFPNYNGTKNYIEISMSDIQNYSGVHGDLDTIIVDYALNLLIKENKDLSNRRISKWDDDGNEIENVSPYYDVYEGKDIFDVAHAPYNVLAKYLTGSDKVTYVQCNDSEYGLSLQDSIAEITDLWEQYKKGEISNLGIGIEYSNYKEGVCGGHAYSLRYLNAEAGYVELINPWDDADVLKITFEDLYEYGFDLIVYGKDLYEANWLVPNGGSIEYLSGTEVPSKNMPVTRYYGGYKKDSVNPFAIPHNIVNGQEQDVLEEIAEINAHINNAKNLIMKQKQSLRLFS